MYAQRLSLLAEEGLTSTSAGLEALPPPGEQQASRENGTCVVIA